MQGKRSKGRLFIVSAPSGAGKTTLCKGLVTTIANITFSVSYTTRQPRPGEVNNVDYTFIGRDEFKRMIDAGEFIEWTEIHGDFYGTSKKRLEELMDSGVDVILDIDSKGAMQLKERYKGGSYIFILPPSKEVLKERLEKRMTDSAEEIEKRLKNAVSEIENYSIYDYVIINDNLEDSAKEIESIVISQRVKTDMINPLWIKEKYL